MDSSSKRVDGGLALHNVVRCLGSPVTPPEQIADYIRLIAVAFPLTSARRSSAYAGQLIADCCGDFPSLAAIPPAFVFGGGPVKRSGPAEAWAQTGIDGRERCHWPGGEGPAALTSSPGRARDGTAPAWRPCAVRRVRPGRGPDRECLLERRRLAGSRSQVTRREDSGSLDPNQLLRPHGTRRPCHDRYKPMEPVSPVPDVTGFRCRRRLIRAWLPQAEV